MYLARHLFAVPCAASLKFSPLSKLRAEFTLGARLISRPSSFHVSLFFFFFTQDDVLGDGMYSAVLSLFGCLTGVC